LLLTLPIIAAIVLVTYRLSRTYIIFNPFFTTAQVLYNFIGVAVAGLCVVVFVRQVVSSASRRRWWTLGVTLVIPTAHVAVGLWAAIAVLHPPLRYQWDKWYTLPVAAVYNMGLLIICWVLLRTIGSGLWRVLRWTTALVRPIRNAKAPAESILR
jgi:hypothetical protein